MINTIFYFVDSLSFNDYTSQIRSGDISKKTIVFVDDTRSIFMGGKSYSYNDSALLDEINHIQETISTLRENIEETISEINTDVQEVSELAQAQKDRLDTLLTDLDDSIKDRIEQLFDDAQWIQQNFPQGVINWQSGWDDQIEAYLSRVGVWSRDNDVTKTQWSNLIQSVNTLEGSVSSLTSTTNGLVTVSEGLDSRINLAINGKIAELNLGTTYAKINDVKGILEWMYSGLKSASSSSLSYNDLVTAAKNDQLGISAISEIRTSIENLGDTYAAKTEMNTLVNDSLASLIQAVDANQTLTGIINQLGTNTSNISSITSRVQAIEGGGYISQSQMLNSLENELDGTTTTSSVKSKVDSVAKTAAATLFSGVSDAQDNITAASIVNAITNDTNASTSLSSYFNSGLTQNQVETIVNTTLDASATGGSWSTWVSSMENGTVKKAEIIASVNNSTESNVKISADKINLSGDTIISKLNDPNNQTVISGNSINTSEIIANGTSSINTLITNQLTGGTATFTGNVNATQFQAGDPNGVNITTTQDTLSFNYGNTTKAYFSITPDGSVKLTMYNGVDGFWYSIDFSQLTPDNYQSACIPAFSSADPIDTSSRQDCYLYTRVALPSNNYQLANADELFYLDVNAQTLATNSNTSNLWIKTPSQASNNAILRIQDCDINQNEAQQGNLPTQTSQFTQEYTLGRFEWYAPICLDSSGHLSIDSSRHSFMLPSSQNTSYYLIPKDGYYVGDNVLVTTNTSNFIKNGNGDVGYAIFPRENDDPTVNIYVVHKVNQIPTTDVGKSSYLEWDAQSAGNTIIYSIEVKVRDGIISYNNRCSSRNQNV